jgi:hypothetical protein
MSHVLLLGTEREWIRNSKLYDMLLHHRRSKLRNFVLFRDFRASQYILRLTMEAIARMLITWYITKFRHHGILKYTERVLSKSNLC